MNKTFVFIVTYNFIDRGTLKKLPCRQIFGKREKANERLNHLKSSASYSDIDICLSEVL